MLYKRCITAAKTNNNVATVPTWDAIVHLDQHSLLISNFN